MVLIHKQMPHHMQGKCLVSIHMVHHLDLPTHLVKGCQACHLALVTWVLVLDHLFHMDKCIQVSNSIIIICNRRYRYVFSFSKMIHTVFTTHL